MRGRGWRVGVRGRLRAAVVLSALVVGTLPMLFLRVPALAHGSDPSVDDSVSGMTPPHPGVTFGIVDSVVPELTARNTTDRQLEILDRFGDPYLRLGPGGVQGNLNCGQFYRSDDPSDTARVPPRAAKVGAAPEWVTLSSDPSWAWFDPRVRSDIDRAPPDVVAAHRRATLAVWSIPLTYDGQQARLDGQVTYAPPVGGAAARLTSPLHPHPDLTVALEPGQYPDVFVTNAGSDVLTVLGSAGEPFARIDASGVSVNLLSPVHAADATARGDTPEMPPNAAAPPQWQHVSDSPSYDWLDPRPRYPGSRPALPVLTAAEPTVLQSWSIPASSGPQQLSFDGVVSWIPAPDARTVLASEGALDAPSAHRSSVPTGLLVLIGAAGAAAALVVLVRRRRGAGPRRHAPQKVSAG